MQLSLNKKPLNKKYIDIFMVILFFGIFLRFAIGIGYYNPQDTLWYKTWAIGLNDGMFDVYSRAEELSLDYPPLYLFFLKITGGIYKAIGDDLHNYTEMFLMKLWPILGDIICAVALFYVLKKDSPKTGLVASALWMFNPSTIFNCAFWGQTDSIMCLLLLLSFVLLERGKPIAAAVVFALAGMTKYQCLFFTPIFLAELFYRYGFATFLKGIISAAATVAVVFVPFMIGSKNPMLFFDVYLGGQGTYPYCTLSAYNIYGIFGLNWKEDTVGTPSLYTLSLILVLVLIALMIYVYLRAERKSVWVLGFLFMNTLFMFMTRMHERYQFVVLIFILMAAVLHRHRGFFYCFMAISIITFLNQAIPMFAWRSEDVSSALGNYSSVSVFDNYYNAFMVIFSLINLAIYVVSAYISVKFMFSKDKEEITKDNDKEEIAV